MVKKFFVIAGESSGDLLGSKLIRELKIQCPDSSFVGVGGVLMKEQGLQSIFPMEELSVMGFLEVFPHIPKLLRRISQTAQSIIEQKPDYVITIDSPDFCFRVIKKLNKINKSNQFKKIHLIAPSVWAYRKARAEKIAKLYDLLLVILPFEPPYFEIHGLKTVFIGHPLIEDAPDFSKKSSINNEFRALHNIDAQDTVILLTPGSRNGEVKRIFPEFIGAINILSQEISSLKIVIPVVNKTRKIVEEMSKNLKVEYFFVEQNQKSSALFSANYGIAKSGTNTLELSLYRVPMIVAYKINFLTHFLLKRMVKIKFANLINLILNQEIIPEMLQKKCEAKQIYDKLKILISNKIVANNQIEYSRKALEILGLGRINNPMEKSANEILQLK